MSNDPKLRQEVYGDGDNVSGNAMEPGGWSLSDDAHKPGRLWTGKSFWMNPTYEAAAIERMFAKCHEDFAVDPTNTSYLIAVPHLPSASWYRTYAKYYEVVKIFPKGSVLYSTKAEGTYRTDTLTPAAEHGGHGRVFVRGDPLAGRGPLPQRPHSPEGRRQPPRAFSVRTCTLSAYRRPHGLRHSDRR